MSETESIGIGEIFLDAVLNTSRIEEQLYQLSNSNAGSFDNIKISPKVDLTSLHELNKLLDRKNAHLRETIANFNNNPIRPKTDLNSLHTLNIELDKMSSRIVNINVKYNVDTSSLQTDLDRTATVYIKREDRDKDVKKEQIQPKQNQILVGALQQFGRDIFGGASKSFTQTIENSLASTIGSSSLIGEKIAKALGNKISSSIILLESNGVTNPFKGVGDEISKAIGEKDIAIEINSARQEKNKKNRQKISAARQAIVEESKSLDRELDEVQIDRDNKLKENLPKMRQLVAKQSRNDQIANKIQQLQQSTDRFEIDPSLPNLQAANNKLRKRLSKQGVDSTDIEMRIIRENDRYSNLQYKNIKFENNKEINAETLARLNILSQKKIKQNEEIQLEIDKLQSELENVQAMRANIVTKYNNARKQANLLKEKRLPKNIQDIIDDVAPNLPEHLVPRIVSDSKVLDEGANADYSAGLNKIRLNPGLYQRAMSGKRLNKEDYKTIREELEHASDFQFGSFKGYQAADEYKLLPESNVGAFTPEEEKEVAKQLVAYDPKVHNIERNAKIKRERAWIKEEQRRNLEFVTKYGGAGGNLLEYKASTLQKNNTPVIGALRSISNEKNFTLPAIDKIEKDIANLESAGVSLAERTREAISGNLSPASINKLVEDITRYDIKLDAVNDRVKNVKNATIKVAQNGGLTPYTPKPKTLKQNINTNLKNAQEAIKNFKNPLENVELDLDELKDKAEQAGRLARKINDVRALGFKAASPAIAAATKGYKALEGVESAVLPFVPFGKSIKAVGKNVVLPVVAYNALPMMGPIGSAAHALIGSGTHTLLSMGTGGMVEAANGAISGALGGVPMIGESLSAAGSSLIASAVEGSIGAAAPLLGGTVLMKGAAKIANSTVSANDIAKSKLLGASAGNKAIGAAKSSIKTEYQQISGIEDPWKMKLPSVKQLEAADADTSSPKYNKNWRTDSKNRLEFLQQKFEKAVSNGQKAMAEQINALIDNEYNVFTDTINKYKNELSGSKKASNTKFVNKFNEKRAENAKVIQLIPDEPVTFKEIRFQNKLNENDPEYIEYIKSKNKRTRSAPVTPVTPVTPPNNNSSSSDTPFKYTLLDRVKALNPLRKRGKYSDDDASFEEAKAKIEKSLNRYENAENIIKKREENAGNPVSPSKLILDKVKDTFNGLGGRLITIAAGGITLGAAAAIATVVLPQIRDGVQKALEEKTSKLNLKFAVPNAGEYDRISEKSKTLANQTGLSTSEVTSSTAAFLANTKNTGLEGENGANVIQGLTRYGAMMGLSKERQQLSATALSQMAGKGKISAEELFGQLAESLPGGAQQFAAAQGMSVEQLRKKMKTGSVDSTTALSKFGSRLNTIANSEQKALENNPQTSFNKLESSITNAQAKLGESALQPLAYLSKVASDGIKLLTDNIGLLASLGSAGLTLLTANAIKATGVFELFSKSLSPSTLGMLGNTLKELAPQMLNIGKAVGAAALQMGLLTVAFEVWMTVLNRFNGGSSFIKKFADDAKEAADAMEKLNKSEPKSTVNKIDQTYEKDKSYGDNILDAAMKGINNTPIGYVLGIGKDSENGASYSSNIKAEQDRVSAQNLLNSTNFVLASTRYNPTKSEKDNADRENNEKALRLLKIQAQNDDVINDEDKRKANQKAQSELITKSLIIDGDPQAKQANIEKAISAVQAQRDRLASSNDPKNKQIIEQLDKELVNLKVSANTAALELSKVSRSTYELTKSIKQSVNQNELNKVTYQTQADNSTTNLLNSTSGSLLTGTRATAQYNIDSSRLQQVGKSEADNLRTQKNILDAKFGEEIKAYQKNKQILSADVANITEDELKNLKEDNADPNLIAAIKAYKDGTIAVRNNAKEQATLRDSRNKALNEEFKASKEYYQDTLLQAKETRLTLEASAYELRSQSYTTKLKAGLSGFSSAMSQYTLGMIDIITQLGKITTEEYDKQKKLAEVEKEKLNLYRNAENKNNAASSPTGTVYNGKLEIASPIGGTSLSDLMTYKPTESQGFNATRDGGKRQHGSIDWDSRVGGKAGSIVNAMISGKITRMAAGRNKGEAWMGDMFKITNGDTTIDQIHLEPSSIDSTRFPMNKEVEVKAGEFLGKVANLQGKASNHQHVAVKIKGVRVDVQKWLSEQMNGTSSDTSSNNSSKVIVARTGELDDKGLEKLSVKVYDAGGKLILDKTANSGRKGKQIFSASGKSQANTEMPLEYGTYQIGKATNGMNAAVGDVFIPIDPKFRTKRTVLGIHHDADRYIKPGSAGCLVFSSKAEFDAFQKAIEDGKINELDFVNTVKKSSSPKLTQIGETNAGSKLAKLATTTTNFTPVKSSFYTPGEGNIAMEGKAVDIHDKKITKDDMVMATRSISDKYGIPYGTKVVIRNPANGKMVTVRAVDNGGLAEGRDIDLTTGVGKALGLKGKNANEMGVASLELLVLGADGKTYDLGKPTSSKVGASHTAGGTIVKSGNTLIETTKSTATSNNVSQQSSALNQAAIDESMKTLNEKNAAIINESNARKKQLKLDTNEKQIQLEDSLIKNKRTQADEVLKTKREQEDANDNLGYKDTPEEQQRRAIRDAQRKNEDEKTKYQRLIDDSKKEEKRIKTAAASVEYMLKDTKEYNPEQKKAANEFLKTAPKLIKEAEAARKVANDRLYQLTKQKEKETQDINMKAADAKKDAIGDSNSDLTSTTIETKKAQLSLIEQFQKTNPFDLSLGDPTALQRDITIQTNETQYRGAIQAIDKQLREGTKDPRITKNLEAKKKELTAALEKSNRAAQEKFNNDTLEIDKAKEQYLFDRAQVMSQSERDLNASEGAINTAKGQTYLAMLKTRRNERDGAQDTLDKSLLEISKFRKDNANRPADLKLADIREESARTTFSNALIAQKEAQDKEQRDKLFGMDRSIDSSNIELLSNRSTSLTKRGNTYDSATLEKDIATKRLESESASKMKEFEDMIAANQGDDAALERIEKLKKAFIELNQLKLNSIEEEFSRFKGIMDETVKASDNIIGKLVGGMGTQENDWLALLRAPFKGITDEISKFLSSTMNEAIHDGLQGLTGFMNKSLEPAGSARMQAGRAEGNQSGFGGLLQSVGRWFGLGSAPQAPLGGGIGGSVASLLLPFFADGGVINPHLPIGQGDKTLIRTNNGEAIMVPEFVKSVGGVAGIERLNRQAKGYANGGVVGANLPDIAAPTAPVAQPMTSTSTINVEYTKIGERDYVDREHLDAMLNKQAKDNQKRLNEYDRQNQDRLNHSYQYRSSLGLR